MGHSDVRHVSRIGQIFVTRAAPFRDDGRPMRCGGERCRVLYQPQPQPPKRRSSDSNSMSQPRVPGISASTFIVIDHQTMLVEFRMINRDHRSSESPPARVFFFQTTNPAKSWTRGTFVFNSVGLPGDTVGITRGTQSCAA